MIGLELMRLLLLGVTLFQNGLTRTRDLLIGMFKRWFAYPIVLGIFLTWRLFIFDSSRSATNTDNLAFSYRSNLYPSSRKRADPLIKLLVLPDGDIDINLGQCAAG